MATKIGQGVARRIVIRKSSGAYQIIGVLNGDLAPGQLPTILESIAELDGGFCELAKIEPRYVLYREGGGQAPEPRRGVR